MRGLAGKIKQTKRNQNKIIKMIGKLKLFIILLFLLFLVGTVSGTDISSCATLSTAGETYYLTQDVSSSGTCMQIHANSITLDCQGHQISYSTSSKGYGIDNLGGYDYIKIKNCVIVQGSTSSYSRGILFLGSTDGVIKNNIITTSGEWGYGILLGSSSHSNTLSGNTITTLGAYGHGISLWNDANSNNLLNNAITISGNWYSCGISLRSSSTNALTGNTITTSGGSGYGIYLIDSSSNNLLNNKITTSEGNNALGILLGLSSNSNNLLNNTITTSGGSGYGIYSYSSSTNALSGNTITTSGGSGYGIYLAGISNTTITKNKVQTNSYSIYLKSSGSTPNSIYNNLFNSTNNFQFGGTTYTNYWNTTKQMGERVYSPGNKIGGNYWTNPSGTGYSDTCIDADRDGFCDAPYTLTSGNVDYLPLSGGYQPPNLPDLTLSSEDITFSNPNPAVGETVTITATIHNTGNADATDVTVQFFDGDPDNGGIQIGENQMIASINASGTGTAQVDWTTTAGSHDIYVIVDPYDDILESDESNNEAHINCVVEVLSDSIKIVDIAPDAETELAVGEEVTFDLTVDYSLASSDWGSIDLSVIDNNGRHFLDSKAISAGSGTAHFTHSEVIQGGFPEDDEKFIVAVNLTNLYVVECVAEDSISYGLLFPDLKVEDISFSDNPKVGDPITITATIRNIGRANVGEFDVVFRNEDAVTPLTVIGKETLDGLMAGGSETVEIEWRWMVICGRNEISVVADDLPPFPERNKDRNNNRLSKEINIECHRADDGRYTPGSKKALILAPYHWQVFIEYSDDLVDDLEEIGWQVDYKINDEVTIENFENWLNEGYGLIHITTHGTENGFAIESFHAGNTLEENKQARNERWDALIGRYGEEEVEHLFRKDSDATKSKPNIMVKGDFIRTRCNGLEQHPLVYFEACDMGSNDDMRETFISMGAGAYLGFEKEVEFCYIGECVTITTAEDVSREFYRLTIDEGYTVGEAVDDDNFPLANGEGCSGYFDPPCVELLNYGNENLILVDPITVTATCPIDLVTTDPEGLIVSRESCKIGGATYTEADINGDGDPDDQIIIPDRKIGDYQITVIPEPDAESTDTYTLTVSAGDTTIVLAENVTISEIPEEPYIFESTTIVCGDVNCDGKVTMSDVRKVFNRYLDPNYPLDLPWAADVNCDGKVTMSDVRKVFNRYLDPGYELNCCCEEVE